MVGRLPEPLTGCLSEGHDDVQLDQMDQFWHLTTRQLQPLADIAAFQAVASHILTPESARHNETSLIFCWPNSTRSHSLWQISSTLRYFFLKPRWVCRRSQASKSIVQKSCSL